MEGEMVRYRPTSLMTRLVSMPIGEPDGRTTPRLERAIQAFREKGSPPRSKTSPSGRESGSVYRNFASKREIVETLYDAAIDSAALSDVQTALALLLDGLRAGDRPALPAHPLDITSFTTAFVAAD
jgi:2-dehydropantoate 2-reductase